MSNNDVPIWEKYTLTIEEASKYFRIGENKLRRLAEENPSAGWVILNGNRIQIKRQKFEKIIDEMKKFASVFEILFWGCSSVGRAPQWHCGGRRFEPDHLHQKGTTDFSLVV